MPSPFMRWEKLYGVFMSSPVNVGLSCHAPSPIRYSQPSTAARVTLLIVALALAGGLGAVWPAFSMVRSAGAAVTL